MGCSLLGSSVRGVLKARMLEWVAISFSRDFSSETGIEPVSPTLQANSFLPCVDREACPHTYLPSTDSNSSQPSLAAKSPGGYGMLEHKLRVSSDSEHLGCIWEFILLTSSQVMWILLICGPDFGNTAPLCSPSTISLSPLKIKKLAFCCCCLVTKTCPTLCDPMDCTLSDSSVHGILDKNTGVGCHFLLWGIFPTQGANLHLLFGRWSLYH